MPTGEECRAYAEEYRRLAMATDISLHRATMLTAISQTRATLAAQLERLAIISKEEGN